jgi:hypothetical protein
MFFFLVYVHIFAYRKIKYKDDGRDYVSALEFLSIHMTFSILHSWVTYFTIFNFFQSIDQIIRLNSDSDIIQYVSVDVLAEICFFIILVEMCIYLAYYKDIIFSLATLINFVGIYVY